MTQPVRRSQPADRQPESLPTVTVAIPVHNRTEYLIEAIESIERQSYRGQIDILVIDDGSDEPLDSEMLVGHLTVRLERQQHMGIAATRTRAAELATTELLAFLDDDDRWPEGTLMRRVNFLLANREVPAVVGDVTYFGQGREPGAGWYRDRFPRLEQAPRVPAKGDYGWIYPKGALLDFVMLNIAFYAQSATIRREWLLELGGWGDKRLHLAEPVEFAYRATVAGPVGFLDEVTVEVRRGHPQMTGDLEQSRLGEAEELSAWARRMNDTADRKRVLPRLARRLYARSVQSARRGQFRAASRMATLATGLALRAPAEFCRRPWR